jgi:hypothetical protein
MNVFVFGANLQGIHGAGAALHAKLHHGAETGRYGRMGACYGIPTKATPWQSLPLGEIGRHVHEFLKHATDEPLDTFQVTPIGCGLAGLTPDQIAPLFGRPWALPRNVILPLEFHTVLDRIYFVG